VRQVTLFGPEAGGARRVNKVCRDAGHTPNRANRASRA
jgi:hypothetical protein